MTAACYTPVALVKLYFASNLLQPDCFWILKTAPRPADVTLEYYLLIFLITCLLEAPFYFWCLTGRSLGSKISATVLLNLATHPVVYFAFPRLVAMAGGKFHQSLLF